MSEQSKTKSEMDKIDLEKMSVDDQQSLLYALEEMGAKRADEYEEKQPKTAIVLASGSPLYPSPTEWNFNERQAHYVGLAKVALEPELQTKSEEERIAIAAFKIEMGREVGLPSAASLKRIHYTNGKFEMDSQGLWGVLINYKKHVEKDIEFKIVERSKVRCLIEVKRPSLFGENWQSFEWLYKTAESAGLTKTAKANKNPWIMDPDGMLWWRSLGKMCRLVFADLFEGFSYASEEAATFEDSSYTTDLPRTTPTVKNPNVATKSVFDDDEDVHNFMTSESKTTEGEIIPETPKAEEDLELPTQNAQKEEVTVKTEIQHAPTDLLKMKAIEQLKKENEPLSLEPEPNADIQAFKKSMEEAKTLVNDAPIPKSSSFDDDTDLALPTAPAEHPKKEKATLPKYDPSKDPEAGKKKSSKKPKVQDTPKPSNPDTDFLNNLSESASPKESAFNRGNDNYASLCANVQDDLPTQVLLAVNADEITEPMKSFIAKKFQELCEKKQPKERYCELLLTAMLQLKLSPSAVWTTRMDKLLKILVKKVKDQFQGSADSCPIADFTKVLRELISTDGQVIWAIGWLEARQYIKNDVATMLIKKGSALV